MIDNQLTPNSNVVRLRTGERFTLSDSKQLALILSGKVEVYAVANDQDNQSFRQLFLAMLLPDYAAFPLSEDIDHTYLFALADSQIALLDFDQVDPQQLKKLMQGWFQQLINLPWLSLLADKGDDVLITWRNGSVLDDSSDLIADFLYHMDIFSTLISIRFRADDKRHNDRLAARAKNQRRLIDDSIASLLGTEAVSFSSQGERLAEATVVVQRVAVALSMPTDNIHLDVDRVRRMDQVRLIRLLIQKGNMQMRLIELVSDWHRQDSGVIIGYFGEDKMLSAFIPTAPGRYKMFNLSQPQGVELTDDLAAMVDKSAFECYGGFETRELKILDLLKFSFRRAWLVDYKTVIVLSLFSGLIPLVMPLVTETIFADIIPILDRQGLATVTQVILVTSFTTASFGIVRTIAVLRLTTRIDMSTEAALWGRLLRLPTKFFRKFSAGELASRMNGINVIKGLVSAEFIGSLFGFVFSFWSIFLMCYYSLKLTAVAIVIWAIYAIITAFIYRRVIGFQRNLIAAHNREAGLVQQIFKGLAKFRISNGEPQAYWLWSRVFGESWKWNLRLRWQGNYNLIIGSVQPFILAMALYYVAVYGMEQTVNGQTVQGLTYAQFIAFQGAFSSFNATLNGIIPLIGQYFAIQPHIENLRPILNEKPESVGDKTDAGILSGALSVSNLSFSYEGTDREVLHDVNFKISAGENVALVGKSGSGKSTLVRLLLGFEKPTRGTIAFDGQDLADLNLPSVRTQMGVVLQNGQLMQGDIFTNIVGTNPLTQEDAWNAAEQAGIALDIAMMPMGMQTVISEGSTNISGGQRQRILIARALVNKPAILIFDEATSALDNRTQAIVTESLDKLKSTRIIVAHRLSTIRNCDRILVMDSGRIVENGSFDELVAQGGIFASLVKRQTA